MSTAAVGQCPQCDAVVNVHWPSCLVCHALLATAPEAGTVPQSLSSGVSVLGEPAPPILPGWLISYRDTNGSLRGGVDDRAHGTVQGCLWTGRTWTLVLTDQEQLPLSKILSVGKIDAAGRVLAAWTVRDHGLDGMGTLHGQ